MDSETYRIQLENDLLKRQLKKEKLARIVIEQRHKALHSEYEALIEFVRVRMF
jgi:hypothetical protein